MNDEERERLADALLRWAEAHPSPDLPVLALARGEELSPRDIAVHVLERSDTGALLVRVFESVTERDPDQAIREPVSVDELVSDLDAETVGFAE